MAEQAHLVDVTIGSDREIRVLVVDDHPGFREVLGDLIAASPGFTLVGVACCGEEAVDAVYGLCPELVLMDVLMPGMGGIAATRAILKSHPSVYVVLTSVEHPALYPGARELARYVSCIRKQDLRPQQLRHLRETIKQWA